MMFGKCDDKTAKCFDPSNGIERVVAATTTLVVVDGNE